MADSSKLLDIEYKNTLRITRDSNRHIDRALSNMAARRLAIFEQQQSLLENNNFAWQRVSEETSGDGLSRRVMAAIKKDEDFYLTLDQQWPRLSRAQKDGILFPIRNHKMHEVITGARAIFGENETTIIKLATGDLPLGYDLSFDPELPPILGQEPFWGTPKVTNLSYAILAVNFALNGNTISDVPLNSAITQVTPLPTDCALSLPDSRYFYQNQATGKIGIAFVHSHYTFGGSRSHEPIYGNDSLNRAEDCSSWLASLIGTIPFTTIDQLYTHRFATEYRASIPATWQNSRSKLEMLAKFDQIQLSEANIGDLYVQRGFRNLQEHNTTTGVGGHTTLIFSVDRQRSTAATLGFSRHIQQNIDGFGIQEFSLQSKPEKLVFALRPK